MTHDLSMFFIEQPKLISPAKHTVTEEGKRELVSEAVYETQVVEKPRPPSFKMEQLEFVISEGRPLHVLIQHAELVELGIQWDWYESYKQWQQDHQEWLDLQAAFEPEVIGDVETTFDVPEPVEPTRPKGLEDISALKSLMSESIDYLAGIVRESYAIGSLMTEEYHVIKQAALNWDGAGQAPRIIDVTATAQSLTPQQVREDVIDKATRYEELLIEIRRTRLECKATIQSASSLIDLVTIFGNASETLNQLRSQ